MGRYFRLSFNILITLLFYGNANAYEIGAGISFSNHYLNIYDQNNTKLTQLEGDAGLWPYLTIKSEDRYFGDDSKFGYSFYGWYTQSSVNKLSSDRSQVLPAPVNLQFLYAGVSVFYVIGGKAITEANGDTQHAIGLGVGWGASRISGDIPAAFISTGVDEHIDSNLTGSSGELFYRYLWGDKFFKITVSLVDVKNGSKSYSTSDSTITFGKYFDF